MIVLDTNAVSEVMKPNPSEVVVDWLDAQTPDEVFITVVTQAELLYGVESLPQASAGLLFRSRSRGFSRKISLAAYCISTNSALVCFQSLCGSEKRSAGQYCLSMR
jgi:predicted nucleic acid-binding protein